MGGDSSNRRTFLKAVGLTAASALLPSGLGAGVANAAHGAAGVSAGAGLGALELWLLDTGMNKSLDAGLYSVARRGVEDNADARGERLPY